ncbi:protein of unknown function [Candidatus Filomicrobium marinum]|uniref:Uncharacterized protein n=2 Tax=Filomicrobium TaxID=119044 RepID=A0A0D6JJJ7_9HYPH|nr:MULTISPECIES: hypothetical protein [Filomicrobium]MCV0370756.1 hypothetical protein [Filomicrobium sp.]CFX30198.1 protein of unknown function [Candidatus Filomicrobium marinum]CPR22101.1 protein of unknown function [Candidatus Filomicrobium marinum]SDP43658.1 hypothetical protein SAMN04488061_2991 [Filomicrobium insigne]
MVRFCRVSAVLNYRFGIRLGGQEEVERHHYSFGLRLADIGKALMPLRSSVIAQPNG